MSIAGLPRRLATALMASLPVMAGLAGTEAFPTDAVILLALSVRSASGVPCQERQQPSEAPAQIGPRGQTAAE